MSLRSCCLKCGILTSADCPNCENWKSSLNLKRDLERFVETRKNINAQIDKISETLGDWWDSPMGDAIFAAQTEYVRLLDNVYSDDERWLEWFVMENDCGSKCMEAWNGAEERQIKTIDDLIWVMKLTGK